MHLPPNLCIRHRILELALISNEHHYDSVYIAPLSSRSPVLQHRHGVVYPSGNWFIMRKPGVQPIAIHNPITPRSGRREPRVSHSPRDVSAADSGEGCSTSVPRLTRVWDLSFLIGRSLRAGSKLLIGRPYESLSLDLRIGVSVLSLLRRYAPSPKHEKLFRPVASPHKTHARIPFADEQKPACLETPTGPAEAIACRRPGERSRCSSSILTPTLTCRERNVSDWLLPG